MERRREITIRPEVVEAMKRLAELKRNPLMASPRAPIASVVQKLRAEGMPDEEIEALLQWLGRASDQDVRRLQQSLEHELSARGLR